MDTKNHPPNPSEKTETTRKPDIEQQRLELEKKRLNLDIEAHEVSRQLDSERILLDRSKERTAKLQAALPIFVSAIIVISNTFAENLRSQQAFRLQEAQYEVQRRMTFDLPNKEGRLELFRRLTDHVTDPKELRRVYRGLFRGDDERMATESSDYERLFEPSPARTRP